jgi:predicted esterase
MKKIFVITLIFALALQMSAFSAEIEKRTAKCGMQYFLDTPEKFSKKKLVPLMIYLHGAGDDAGRFFKHLRKEACVGVTYLGVGPVATNPGYFDQVDRDKIAALIEELKSQYNIKHVILYGFSRGAFQSLMVALKYPYLVNGAIVNSGGNPWGAQVAPEPDAVNVAVYLIHGTGDGTVNIENSRNAKKDFDAKGFKWTKFEEIPGMGHQMDKAASLRAIKWIEDVIKKGGGGGSAPLTKDEIDKAADKAIALAKEKKFDEALSEVATLGGKCRYINDKNGKFLLDKILPLTGCEDRGEKLFAVKALGFAGVLALANITAILDNSKADEELSLAAVFALGGCTEKALTALHPLLKSEEFGGKKALAAIEAVARIRSKSSVKYLVGLLEELEKAGGDRSSLLTTPIQNALQIITGTSQSNSESWKKWMTENNIK